MTDTERARELLGGLIHYVCGDPHRRDVERVAAAFAAVREEAGAIRIETVRTPDGQPVAAPCAISGCEYERLHAGIDAQAQYAKAALQRAEQAEAERDRLRNALAQIATGKVAKDMDNGTLTAVRLCGIARAALAPRPGEEGK